jgi:hypothetical protein
MPARQATERTMSEPRKSATPLKAQSDKRRENADERRKENKATEHPQREPDPDTLEGPGDRQEAKGEEDARNKTTRRGER